MKLTQSLLCNPSHHSRMRLLSHWIASVRYLLPTVSPFKSLPIQPLLSPMLLNIHCRLNPKRTAMNRP